MQSAFLSPSNSASTRLARLDNPRELGEALAGSKLGNYWKYRVGDWRINCDLQDQRIVVRVLRVGIDARFIGRACPSGKPGQGEN